jgi:hypothetical protein
MAFGIDPANKRQDRHGLTHAGGMQPDELALWPFARASPEPFIKPRAILLALCQASAQQKGQGGRDQAGKEPVEMQGKRPAPRNGGRGDNSGHVLP